ncbi:MAG: hypothetical protein GY798_28980 [Hyphomicrobiales bacterium]|nr:hypothetical protein [Hyphomicrobiales bacterium]
MSVSMPLDNDGFLRRECPSCEQEFKWFAHEEGDVAAESVEQYFCPLCGSASDLDSWWTPAQLEYAQGSAGPSLDQAVQDLMEESFKGVKGISFEPSRNFSLEIPTQEPLAEPDDMEIVQPPCHPNEPVKIPETAVSRLHCLICGEPFAV